MKDTDAAFAAIVEAEAELAATLGPQVVERVVEIHHYHYPEPSQPARPARAARRKAAAARPFTPRRFWTRRRIIWTSVAALAVLAAMAALVVTVWLYVAAHPVVLLVAAVIVGLALWRLFARPPKVLVWGEIVG